MAEKSFFFDFGNVVAFFDHRKACRQLAGFSDGQFSEEQIYDEIFKPGGIENQYDRGQISSSSFIEGVILTFNLALEPAEVEHAWCDIFSLNQPTINLLVHLKDNHYPLFLASNTNSLHYKWIKEKYADELSLFDDEVLSFQIGFRKPERGFFDYCVRMSGGVSSDCFFIDDRTDFIQVARQAGMKGILYQSHTDLVSELEALGIMVIN